MVQRQRWAMDSLRLLIRDCPLTRPGLRWRHRLHYLQTTSFYLVSCLQLVFVGTALGYAFTRLSVVNAPDPRPYLVHTLPYLLTIFAFLVIAQRGLVNAVRGLQVLLFTAPMFAAATVRVLAGRTPPRPATLKHRERRLSGHLIAPAVLLGALIVGLAHVLRDGRPGLSPIGLFWVAFSAFLLAGPIATVTWRPHLSAGLGASLRAAIAGVAVLALPATATVAPLTPGLSRAEAALSPDSYVVLEKRAPVAGADPSGATPAATLVRRLLRHDDRRPAPPRPPMWLSGRRRGRWQSSNGSSNGGAARCASAGTGSTPCTARAPSP